MQTLFNAPFLQIHYDGFAHAIELEWLDFANSSELRQGLNAGLTLAQQYHVRAWIGNLKQMRVIRPQDQDWINNDWFPRFARLDILHMAVVESDDVLNRQGVTHVMQRANGLAPLSTAYFINTEAARRWIRTAAFAFQP
ncbi:hypothetical protein [Hymenobacter chitinivorans]|uniref:SpoIIAA-like protein n=1 Tax=Hymenobacter chitinivorans DSM 11115 TaxID=1121954 RepID=A0A2M9BQV6_9BACT|nr:hypothetical protein [Hymenobacter chitinivorans]PJJ60341.1 hypothetical protein CLV45_1766 [Hymenobacter chitinivorans DSM 11115]